MQPMPEFTDPSWEFSTWPWKIRIERRHEVMKSAGLFVCRLHWMRNDTKIKEYLPLFDRLGDEFLRDLISPHFRASSVPEDEKSWWLGQQLKPKIYDGPWCETYLKHVPPIEQLAHQLGEDSYLDPTGIQEANQHMLNRMNAWQAWETYQSTHRYSKVFKITATADCLVHNLSSAENKASEWFPSFLIPAKRGNRYCEIYDDCDGILIVYTPNPFATDWDRIVNETLRSYQYHMRYNCNYTASIWYKGEEVKESIIQPTLPLCYLNAVEYTRLQELGEDNRTNITTIESQTTTNGDSNA